MILMLFTALAGKTMKEAISTVSFWFLCCTRVLAPLRLLVCPLGLWTSVNVFTRLIYISKYFKNMIRFYVFYGANVGASAA